MDSPLSEEDQLKMYQLIDPDNIDKHALTMAAKRYGITFDELLRGIRQCLSDGFLDRYATWAWAAVNDLELIGHYDSYLTKHKPF